MNPNREHIDDEVSVEVSSGTDFRTWLTGPPRRAKRDLIFAPLVVVFAITWFAFAISTASPDAFPGGGVVLAGVAWQVAEVLPVQAVRSAMLLRIMGMVLFVAAMVSVLVVPVVDGSW